LPDGISGNVAASAAGLVEAVTHRTARTVNHGLEAKMTQGLTADVVGNPP
jgi:aldehyde dehydrogenase (NAD+)